MARFLLGTTPSSARFTFDPHGSYAQTYKPQGADLAFVTGLMDETLTNRCFFDVLDRAESQGVRVEFNVTPLERADHPNTVRIELTSRKGESLTISAKSVGGGAVVITRLNAWEVSFTGKYHEMIVETTLNEKSKILESIISMDDHFSPVSNLESNTKGFIHFQSNRALAPKILDKIKLMNGLENVWTVEPLYYVRDGEPLFSCAKEMVAQAEAHKYSLGRIALEYESRLLNLSPNVLRNEMVERFRIMQASVEQGMNDSNSNMKLLKPSAGPIFSSEKSGQVAIGGIHTRAAARALAVMHINNSMGIVCAAPTGGSAGVIPGIVVSLVEEMGVDQEQAAMLLFAAGAIGLIVAQRATFAAEVAGCQVEIGAAGAMGAAAVVEFAGGSTGQAVDAAAIALQNTMGSVCDLVQGACEIPCHTRNAVAASNAFVCGDLILGGYENPIPLDETIDAMYEVGKMLPSELRCTARGGLAVCPSALALGKK